MLRARAHLKRARQLQAGGNTGEFYEEIVRALQGYLGERFHLPARPLTRAELASSLQTRSVSATLAQQLGELLDRCTTARVAPASVALEQMEATWQEAASLLTELG